MLETLNWTGQFGGSLASAAFVGAATTAKIFHKYMLLPERSSHAETKEDLKDMRKTHNDFLMSLIDLDKNHG